MAKKAKQLNPKVRAWFEARERHHLSHAQIQMARELRMNQAKLGKLDNHTQEQWKLPLPRFIEELCLERFGKTTPEIVMFIEERVRLELKKREARRAAKQQRAMESG